MIEHLLYLLCPVAHCNTKIDWYDRIPTETTETEMLVPLSI